MINYVYQLVAPGTFSVKYEEAQFESQVIIKPRYMSICHADQRYYTGQRERSILDRKLPMALIHECCGEVLFDPSGKLKSGEEVVLIPNVPGEHSDIILENYAKGAGFLSSGRDGFLREFISLPEDRLVRHEGIPQKLAAITEFVSVAAHSIRRFDCISHGIRNRIGVWGDGSLSFIVANLLKQAYPGSEIIVIGKNPGKLSYFTFADETILRDELPAQFEIDHAFECCGGDGSYYAIEDIINHINPQGTVMLMGVSENRVAVNTRDVLEKGLAVIGSSRSGRADFEQAVSWMKNERFQRRLDMIIFEDEKVSSVEDIHRAFRMDRNTPFKTVFEWGL
ncbi:alcohol dehydrogenase catalytic domain-containing protein [Dorea sp. D27]|uniref:alcohol dehydrogenase catalytic domain-containing protein n=1 Tax=Dorea sp. D27 TaxID=658665 RepID=UPI0006739B60|nr:alcohol dehydrogenase catalytic domain-containing protein [Dorea sp. D27]KMZ53291.1 alcohol dehydrogenase [Dorea sp. D27]